MHSAWSETRYPAGIGNHRLHGPTTEHPLHPLARHRPRRPALRLPGPDPEHPDAGRPGGPLPRGLLRRADLLRQPRQPADRPLLPQQRDGGARPPRLGAARLRAALGPRPAPRRLPLDPGRRAAHLQGPGGDRLRRGDQGRVEQGRGRGAADDRRPARGEAGRQAVVHVGRLLRDPPRLRGADLGPRHPLLAAAVQPARSAGDASRHGRVQGQRALARPGDRRRAPRPPRPPPGRRHPGHLHHRPRRRLPRLQGDADRPRHRRDDDHARPGRLRRRQGDRPAGHPPRRLPDALRGRRGGAARLAPGQVADPVAARRDRRRARGDLRRDDLPRRLRAAALGPHRALEVHPPLRRLPRAGARQLRRLGLQAGLARCRLGRAHGRPRAALRPGARPGGAEQPGRRSVLRRGAGGDAPPAGRVDAGDRRSAARRPGRAAGRAPR